MSWKLHLLCLGAAIPFGIWGALMVRSGITNPMVTAMILFTGSMVPFFWGLNLTPTLRPEVSFSAAVAIAIAYGVAILHGIGHRSYQQILTHYSKEEIAAAGATTFFEMAAFMFIGNFLVLGDRLSWQKVLAMATGGLTIWLYTR
ncbi:MAG: hypothetical protein A2122_00660 [Candidatus Liptonbacteria bacterium GWB1_49_6]|uniref:EamA domain-containing protein n=1 Tax=Candidatus Liptonbacteria bacterium GWB1_49_6 TaxID=1798644 RepID=A0A1G2C4C9_9BACT|nr:MAG: hypothetical protein A2122_00660 [Candidatus Liptonbacteria bacterium GWB1_49_6]